MTDGDLAMVFVVDDDPQVRASIRGLKSRLDCARNASRQLNGMLRSIAGSAEKTSYWKEMEWMSALYFLVA